MGTEPREAPQWGRAVLTTIMVLAAAVVLLLLLPQLLVTRLPFDSRAVREIVTTLEFTLGLAALAWAVRRRQDPHGD